MNHISCNREINELKQTIENLKRAMQIHGGDICSINCELDRALDENQELEEKNDKLQAKITKFVDYGCHIDDVPGAHCILVKENRQFQAKNKQMRDYLQKLYEGDGNFEFDELEQTLKDLL